MPNAHEPLVSEDDFTKAQLIYQKKKYSDKPEHIFGNKVKCPACGHAMTRYTRQNPRFKCGTAKLRALLDKCDAAESVVAELKPLRMIDTLNRDVVDILIDKILIYSEKEIEIIWNERFAECQA